MRKKENKQEKGRNIQSVYMSQGPAEGQIFANQLSLSQKGGGGHITPTKLVLASIFRASFGPAWTLPFPIYCTILLHFPNKVIFLFGLINKNINQSNQFQKFIFLELEKSKG